MNYIKKLLVGLAFGGLFVGNAMARDSVRFTVYAGSVANTHPVISHYPNTVIYGKTPQVIYYGAPTAIQYLPVITQRFGNHRSRGHNARGHNYNYYRDWNNGWQRNRGHHHHRNHVNKHHERKNSIGHYRGHYKSRW